MNQNTKQMTNTIKETNFNFPGQTRFYKGKGKILPINNETLL